jgi:hypothetical protein
VGVEACAGAHHIGRRLSAFGHNVRLIPAQYVKPFRKGQKNDYRNAEAIAEAVSAADHDSCRSRAQSSSIFKRYIGFAAGSSPMCDPRAQMRDTGFEVVAATRPRNT